MMSTAMPRDRLIQKAFTVFALLVVIAASGLLGYGAVIPLAAITALVLTLALIGVAARAEDLTLRSLFWVSVGYAISTALWPRYVALFVPGLPSLNPTRILNALLLVLLLASIVVSPRARAWWRESFEASRGIWILMGVFILFRMVSIAVSDNPLHSTYTFTNELFVHVVMFLLGIVWVRFDPQLKGMVRIALLGFVVVSLIGLVEWRLATPLFGSFVDPSNSYVEWAASGKIRDGVYRAQSTLGYPIAYAEFIVLAAGVALAGALGKRSAWIRLPLVVGIPVLLAAAVVSSGSRSGYIAGALVIFGVVSASVMLRTVQRRVSIGRALFWTLASAFFVAALAVVLQIAFDRAFGRGADRGSDAYRVTMHQRAASLATESPLLGYGTGRAAYHVKVVTPGVPSQYTIDSYFVSLLVDSGIPALLSFVAAVGLACLRGLHRAAASPPSEALCWAALPVVLLGELLFKSIISIYDNNLFIFALIGCLAAAPGGRTFQNEVSRVPV